MQDVAQDALFDLDLEAIKNNEDFKEDSVREIIILPLLHKLGYTDENIIRSKTLQHPFMKTGSNKNIAIKLVPDYVVQIDNSFVLVLDAKSPKQKIVNNDNVEQAYSYAIHPEIHSNYFALCNGIEFSLFRTSNPTEPILFFEMQYIAKHWYVLARYLSSTSFHSGKNIAEPFLNRLTDTQNHKSDNNDDWYNNRPALDEISVKKQAAKRHFGVHGYFTRQAWNVVREYIRNYSQPGDLVLDSFGGSGVTLVEALMTDRRAIHIDLNPMSIFLTESLIAPIDLNEFDEAFKKIKTEYLKHEPKTKEEVEKALKKYKLPEDLPLPKGSDVETVRKLFSKKQLTQLALLKSIIKKQKNDNIRKSLLLCFSGTVTKINKTAHTTIPNANEKTLGGTDAAAFRYYRYRIANKITKINVIEYFEVRYKKIVAAKKDISYFINKNTIENAQVIQGTATDLSFLPNESVDYIYTDPPYGKKIPYLDLSVMWNAWLDLDVTEDDYKMEAIVGGEHNQSKQKYNDLITKSIQEMYRVLKSDRWLSFVFAHKDPEFWNLIVDTAEKCGFEYKGAFPQKNGKRSFKKIQNPFTVLSGQLIINFRKARTPRAIMRANLGMNTSEIVMQTVEGIIAKHNGATLEQINDELIIKGLELGFLDLLKKEYSDLTPILRNSFDYDDTTELFTIHKGAKFTTHIPLEFRIRYYLISYLRRMEREEKNVTFDEIILHIMPLLKNGVTPERQTMLNVLETIAEQVGEHGWRLLPDDQQNITLPFLE